MCHAVRCRECGKVTWAGCGDHVDQALAGFAPDDLCECADGAPADSRAGGPASSAAEAGRRGEAPGG